VDPAETYAGQSCTTPAEGRQQQPPDALDSTPDGDMDAAFTGLQATDAGTPAIMAVTGTDR
jgi:hypothetical protein